MTDYPPGKRPAWLTAIRRYLIATVGGSLVWETAQMPLYTLWQTGTAREIAQAVTHCTLGDIVIATVALVAALVVAGSPAWPHERAGSVIVVMVTVALVYTIYSEYLNTVVRGAWTYTEWMPTVPWLGTGLSPLTQWLIIPIAALMWAAQDPATSMERHMEASHHE